MQLRDIPEGDRFEEKIHIIRSAQVYRKTNRCLNRRVRFDVVGIDGDNVGVIKHAFGEDG